MNTESNVIELFGHRPPIYTDEDFLTLLDNGVDKIVYVRNYVCSQEFIVASNSIVGRLPEEHRPITNVFVQPNFYVLRRFKRLIREHVLQSGQLLHFQHLFDCSVSEFFENL